MAGKMYAGLSGGQRKILLFEIMYQRCLKRRDHPLKILLDEPFCGVTDNYMEGFILPRLRALKYDHNIVLASNDHVGLLQKLADTVITVTSFDRSFVHIVGNDGGQLEKRVNREQAIADLGNAEGEPYQYEPTSGAELKFFFDVEVRSNKLLTGVIAFAILSFALFVATFWNSDEENEVLVLIAGGIVCYFCISPYLLSLIEWRNCMLEETEALFHSSPTQNQVLKTAMTASVMVLISICEYGAINLVTNGLSGTRFFVGMLCESFALSFPYVLLGIYTRQSFATVQMIAGLPFLLLIFFSTTYSPGAGLPGLKGLRFLFARFYFWCMVPSIDGMEGCLENQGVNMVLMVFSSCISLWIFLVVALQKRCAIKTASCRKQRWSTTCDSTATVQDETDSSEA